MCDLPEQVSVEAPGNEIPSELAGFSGAWSGDGWNANRSEPLWWSRRSIRMDRPVAIFAWGDIARAKLPRGWWLRVTASINPGDVELLDSGYRDCRVHHWPGWPVVRPVQICRRQCSITPFFRASRARTGNTLSWPAKACFLERTSRSRWFPVQIPVKTCNCTGYFIEARWPVADRSLFSPAIRSLAEDARQSTQSRAVQVAANARARLFDAGLAAQGNGRGGNSGGKFAGAARRIPFPGRRSCSPRWMIWNAAVTFMKQQQYVDPSQIVVMGLNRGGLLSVAYAGSHDGAVAGAVNLVRPLARHAAIGGRSFFPWKTLRQPNWPTQARRRKCRCCGFTAAPIRPPVQYARENFRAFTYQGGRGTFVEASVDGKPDTPNRIMIEKREKGDRRLHAKPEIKPKMKVAGSAFIPPPE